MAEEVILVAGKDPLEETGGGHSSYVRMWARAAQRAGFAPHVFSVSHGRGLVETDFGLVHRIRSPFFWLPDPNRTGFRQDTCIWHAGLLAEAIAAFVRTRRRPCLLHGFGVWASAGFRAALALRRAGIPCRLVTTYYTTLAHEYEGKRRGITGTHGISVRLRAAWELLCLRLYLNRLERMAYRGSDAVLVNYDSVRRILERQWGRNPRVRKVGYTSEVAFLGQACPASGDAPPSPVADLAHAGAPLIVSISRHDPRKGVDVLIRALARLKAGGVSFRACLIGRGGLLPAHRRLVESLGLAAVVAIPGYVQDVRPYLRAADVFALPSHEEGSGSVSMLEAMQEGKAIIASGVDGIPEDVADRDSGLLVPPGDDRALAEGLRELIGDARLRAALGARARRVFEERFSPDAVVRAVREVYDGLLGGDDSAQDSKLRDAAPSVKAGFPPAYRAAGRLSRE